MADKKVNVPPSRPNPKNQPSVQPTSETVPPVMIPGMEAQGPKPELKPSFPDFEGKLHHTFSDAHNSNLAIKAKK